MLLVDRALDILERPDVIRALDVAVSSSDFEGSPLSVMEYMEGGKPVVATRVGGVPETAAPGAGVLVEPGDARALADALASLLADPDAWPAMGARGRAHVEANLDNARLMDALLERYRAMARP